MLVIQKPKKSLGQNFLVDKNIINKIVKIGNIDKNTSIVEIGPGYGSLTKELELLKPKRIFAIEKDKKLHLILKKKFNSFSNVKIINTDIFNVIENNNFGKNIIVFGNLPYNISTKILASFVLLKKWPPWYRTLIFMFQKEVADRIVANTHTKEFSRLTVLANWRFNIKKHFNISNNCFFPKPKISSTVLSFTPKKNIQFNLKNPLILEKVTRILFSNRRKMMNKSFNKLFNNNRVVAKKLNINLNQRVGELSNETFYKIALEYESLFG